MRKNGSQKIGLCVYCGETKPLTTDHVVARCFFQEPLPSNMLTVPACDSCNAEKGCFDTYLRDLTVLDIQSSANITAQNLREKMFRSNDRNRSEIGRAVKSTGTIASYYTEGGIYLGDLPAYKIDWMKIGRGLEFIARGLNAKLREQPLPPNGCKFDFTREKKLNFQNFLVNSKKDGFKPHYYSLGNSVFSCIVVFDERETFLSCIWISFYESVFFRVIAMPLYYDVKKFY